MSFRLAHIWLRGYSDARAGKQRAQCYVEEARGVYERGYAVGV